MTIPFEKETKMAKKKEVPETEATELEAVATQEAPEQAPEVNSDEQAPVEETVVEKAPEAPPVELGDDDSPPVDPVDETVAEPNVADAGVPTAPEPEKPVADGELRKAPEGQCPKTLNVFFGKKTFIED